MRFLQTGINETEIFIRSDRLTPSKPIFHLLNNNLVDTQTSILVDQLLKTFRIALAISRLFNKQYIWIDSLYIILDSEFNWAEVNILKGQKLGGFRGVSCSTPNSIQTSCKKKKVSLRCRNAGIRRSVNLFSNHGVKL
jgi:hypothetical protein